LEEEAPFTWKRILVRRGTGLTREGKETVLMPLRIGHRGAAGTHPENTMASFRRAGEVGADGVEFDVHRTRDGHLMVIHDYWLDRTTTGTGMIRGLSLEEVRQADAGVKTGEQFAGERVPTLQELIRSTSPELRLFLELKAGSVHYPGIEEELVAFIRAEGVQDRVQVSSFDHKALRRLHGLDPNLQLGMLYGENLLDPVGMAKAVGASALHPVWEWVTPDMVEAAHVAGLQVNTWTVNLPEAVTMMRACGVDGIMSDFPERL
jgi:glycerophosphoryl diester phosphodiesterase